MGREKIINAIKNNKPARRPLPALPEKHEQEGSLPGRFIDTIGKIGGRIVEVENIASLQGHLTALFPEAGRLLSTVPGLPIGDIAAASQTDVHLLADLDLAIVPGLLGVAENGAIWTTEAKLGHRALPFIAQHLVIVLKREKIVGTMHDAYRQIKIDDTGFGVFIAGPSKTADIEQSLVIGAHGARSLTVILV